MVRFRVDVSLCLINDSVYDSDYSDKDESYATSLVLIPNCDEQQHHIWNSIEHQQQHQQHHIQQEQFSYFDPLNSNNSYDNFCRFEYNNNNNNNNATTNNNNNNTEKITKRYSLFIKRIYSIFIFLVILYFLNNNYLNLNYYNNNINKEKIEEKSNNNILQKIKYKSLARSKILSITERYFEDCGLNLKKNLKYIINNSLYK